MVDRFAFDMNSKKILPLRVMYWPNEPAHLYPQFTQAGGRAAFEAMLADGTISALQIYSQRVERAKFDKRESFEEAALNAVETFAPDILFVQHLFGTDVSEYFWSRVKIANPQLSIIYHEDDAFDPFVKRMDTATTAICRKADLTLISGRGALERHFKKVGSERVGYVPSCFPAERFARLSPTQREKAFDIIMIGNRGRRRRLKFLYIPGGRKRALLATRLSKIHGSRFALFGSGWNGIKSARGKLPFFEQERAIQSARISVNWDNYDTVDYYFSDRLPISLAAGIPHVTSWHPGYDNLFANCPGLYACKSIDEIIKTCRWLLSRPDTELLEEGLAAREWALAHLEANVVFRNAMEQAATLHQRKVAL